HSGVRQPRAVVGRGEHPGRRGDALGGAAAGAGPRSGPGRVLLLMRALRAAPALAGAAILVACVVSFAAPPAGDPAAGEQVYARCLACHSPDRNRTGPKHCGLFGRVSGTAPGYDGYSEAMRDAAITWNAK